MTSMYEFYAKNDEFRRFVDNFCLKHRTIREGALKCMEVKDEYIRLIQSNKSI